MIEKAVVKDIVAFCVLMENGEGVMDKSPEYIMEKFNRYCLSEDPDEWHWGLDASNWEKLEKWSSKWLK